MNEDDEKYAEWASKLEQDLVPFLTDEFLKVLVLAVETAGWSLDFSETSEFARWCFKLAGKPEPQFRVRQ